MNGVGVVAGDHFPTADVAMLVYVPDAGYAGSDSFTWDGWDGSQYSDAPATVSLIVDPVGSDIVTQWNILALGIHLPQHGHGFLVGRLQTMMHAAIYDAVAAFDDRYASYYATTPPPAGASMEAAATAAAYHILYSATTDPTQRTWIQARLDDHLADIPDGQAEAAGVAFGENVADAIMILRGTDGAMMAPHMEHPDGTLPGEWRRTASGAPLAPGWGTVTPWVMTSGDQFRGDGPPELTSDGTAQRSVVRQLALQFSESVSASLSVNDLVVLNLDSGLAVSPADMALTYTPATNTAVWTFPGLAGGTLPDGNYVATLPAASVSDAAGNAMSADHTFDFFRFFGDSDGDRDVDAVDLFRFRATYLRSAGGPLFDARFDSDNDGDVDAVDLFWFRQNYLKTLAPAPAAL